MRATRDVRFRNCDCTNCWWETSDAWADPAHGARNARELCQLVPCCRRGTALAMGIKVVWKKARDFAFTLAVLAGPFGTLMAVNPRVREQFAQMTSVQGRESLGPVRNAAYAAVSVGSDYAADNPFLFSFLVAAAVLFMLMLRS